MTVSAVYLPDLSLTFSLKGSGQQLRSRSKVWERAVNRKAENMHQAQAQSTVNRDKFKLQSIEFNPGQDFHLNSEQTLCLRSDLGLIVSYYPRMSF